MIQFRPKIICMGKEQPIRKDNVIHVTEALWLHGGGFVGKPYPSYPFIAPHPTVYETCWAV